MVNTVTLYRSPIRLVHHALEETGMYSSQAISRARKKMMAEIALAGDEIIIDDVAYSRNDASTLLDLITEDAWKVHSIIYAHKGLLNFLEKEEFNNEELRKADAYLYNEKFVQGISPYFAHSFNSVSGKLLRQDKFEELTQLLNYQGYILPEHSHEAYQKIRTSLDELNYTLRNLSWEKFAGDESILHFLFSDEWKRFVNKLPSSFTSLRDELVEQITGIVLRFQHKATWYYLHQVLVQLKAVETNDFNRSEVERIDKVMYDNSRVEGGKGVVSRESDGFSWRSVWWIVWVVLVIVRAATCNNRSNNDFKFDNTGIRTIRQQQSESGLIDEQRNEPLLLGFLDSLGNKRNAAIYPLSQEIQTGSQPFSSFANDFPQAGEDTIHITNNTAHNCVALHIGGRSQPGSVYQGALPDVSAVYIKKGETYTFRYDAGKGKFYFLFGDDWGKLRKQGELTLRSGYSNFEGRHHLLFVYEFFSNKKTIRQKYLSHAVYASEASVYKDKTEYNYLNNPYAAALNEANEITLLEKNNEFSIKAKGSLQIKEDKLGKKEKIVEGIKEVN